MSTASIERIDRRSHDLLTLPRAGVEESWMDVQALTWETRRDIGRAYQDTQARRSPVARLISADRRLIRLHQFARRKAGEAAGISFIPRGQLALPLHDGCLGPEASA